MGYSPPQPTVSLGERRNVRTPLVATFVENKSLVHTSNNVEATFDFVDKNGNKSNEFIVKFSPFDKVECCFDTVAVLATMLPVSGTLLSVSATVHFVLSTK